MCYRCPQGQSLQSAIWPGVLTVDRCVFTDVSEVCSASITTQQAAICHSALHIRCTARNPCDSQEWNWFCILPVAIRCKFCIKSSHPVLLTAAASFPLRFSSPVFMFDLNTVFDCLFSQCFLYNFKYLGTCIVCQSVHLFHVKLRLACSFQISADNFACFSVRTSELVRPFNCLSLAYMLLFLSV